MTVIASVVPSRKGNVSPAWNSQCVLPPTEITRVAPFRHSLLMATKWVAENCTVEGGPFKEQAPEEYFKFRHFLLVGYVTGFSSPQVDELKLDFTAEPDSLLAEALVECGLNGNLAWPAGYTAIRVTRREREARVELLKQPQSSHELYYHSRISG